MDSNINIVCPIRGQLGTKYFAKDGLTVSEEARRIECIKYLLKKKYPKENFECETIIIKNIGHKGKSSLRADIVVYDIPRNQAISKQDQDRNKHIVLVGEIKRDNKQKTKAITFQLEPAMRQIDRTSLFGVYWDDIHRQLYIKKIEGGEVKIIVDELGNIPNYGNQYRYKKLKYADLIKPEDITATLTDIANILRSNQINDEQVRYRETVKLLLAKYIDERESKESMGDLVLQVVPGSDPDFMNRVKELYAKTARRYSKAPSIFDTGKSALNEKIFREIVKKIQGLNLLDSSSDSMQQVFMTFVPAVFKKDLDQYFTPLTLVNCMVEVLRPGPNDKIADPAMGTADFLTATMQYRMRQNDPQVINRVFGADKDPQAYELAVINMILNKDGQTNLHCIDSIENYQLWEGQMDVALCNPPFGSRTVESRSEVLSEYDLGHEWVLSNGEWEKTETILESQQLGILFIERCFKLLADGGRMGIILPEGFLCTATYGYVRQWILNSFQVIGLVELPRRIFLKSDADLRSNILFAIKNNTHSDNYPIHAELVRKVGYKLGKGFFTIPKRSEETGLEIRDPNSNELLIDTDFTRVKENFVKFIEQTRIGDDSLWRGARVENIKSHPLLDMKPRRLTFKALANLQSIEKGAHKKLGDIAIIVDSAQEFKLSLKESDYMYLIEGQDIRAVEGVVILKDHEKRWQVEVRKTSKGYKVKHKDIVVGLVRPERRNIGLYLYDKENVFASSDGVAIIREKNSLYPVEWIFQILRTERCRIQFWTESGGTSYGKLTIEQIRNVLIPIPDSEDIAKSKKLVSEWSKYVRLSTDQFQNIWDSDDKIAILNSPLIGLEVDPLSTSDGDEE